MSIGSRIKARRQALRLTQRELAARLGYSNHSTVARVESDKIDLPQSRVAQFAQALGVGVGELMGWDDKPEELGALAASVLRDPALMRLAQDFQKLSETDRATVSALVSRLAQKEKE